MITKAKNKAVAKKKIPAMPKKRKELDAEAHEKMLRVRYGISKEMNIGTRHKGA